MTDLEKEFKELVRKEKTDEESVQGPAQDDNWRDSNGAWLPSNYSGI